MNRSIEHENRFSNQPFPPTRNQDNNIGSSSNFIPETERNNLFSFSLPSNEVDIFDLSTDIYDLPQATFFHPDSSYYQDSHPFPQTNSNSNSASNQNSFQPNNNDSNGINNHLQLPKDTQDKPVQDTHIFKSDIFGPDVISSLNLLSYTNKNHKNTEFKTLRDYDTSPEGYVDYNKNPDTDDIFFFERKNLFIQNHQIKLKNEDENVNSSLQQQNLNESNKFNTKEMPTSRNSVPDSFGNSFFNSDFFSENVFDDQQEKQQPQQPQMQPQSLPINFSSKENNHFSFNPSLFSDNRLQHIQQAQPQLPAQPQPQPQPQLSLQRSDQQIQSMPQFNINTMFPNLNIPFSSPSSTNDLYQYHSNNGNAISQLSSPFQFQYQDQSQNQPQTQRSSTAPIPSPLAMNNSMSSSTSTIPIDFSMGAMTTDDPNTLFSLSAQSFNMAMSNRTLIFQPMALSFEPYEYWLFQERSLSFSDLVCKFFRHNKTNFTKFMYKLYDMLRITTVFPSLRQAIGVYFINDLAISVDKYAMINMLSLNPKNVDGSLFHKQGNFPTHGFIEVTNENYKEAGFTSNPVYKSKSIRILFHKDHKFVNKVMTTAELDAIAYENKSKKTYKRK